MKREPSTAAPGAEGPPAHRSVGPVWCVPSEPRRAVEAARPDKRSVPRILVVEADAATRDALQHLLTARGWAVTCAAAGADALELARRQDFEIAILGLAGSDGCGLVAQLAARPEAPEVVVLSARPSVAQVVEVIRSGASDYLARPIDERHVLDVVERAVQRARTRRQGAAADL